MCDIRMGNVLDRNRWNKVIMFLLQGSHTSLFMNGYLEVRIVREQQVFFIVTRRSDQCVLYAWRGSDPTAEKVTDDMIHRFQNLTQFTKCLCCLHVSKEGSLYCQHCELMTSYHEEACSICLEEEKKDAVWVQLSCNHIFHYNCISMSLSIQKMCPLCRAPTSEKLVVY